ncbi:hypothetical protein SAMN05216371_7114 [Streptomyces sp. TLI_053]|uniref:hypothetical protein n=1 Tax=Streptomyces sp. TLI_053 TaxID=1855352 RepID=UPI00087C58BE|nr:hypothetical protein [Streptomyces sp. TLI_053]SDT82329.1 hypothetical protein SAMN05216371_7114 [Streptomyces sp. TLI_053]
MSTPRPDSDPAPATAPVPVADVEGDADRTVRPAPVGDAGPETVRLGSGAGAAVDRSAADGPDAENTVRIDPEEAVSATFLDPGVWGGAGETVEAVTLVDTPARGTAAPAGEDATETVRLDPATGGPEHVATVRVDPEEAVSATFLDPGAWGGAGETVEAVTLVDTPAHGTAAPAGGDPALTVTAPAGRPSVVAVPGPPPADLAPAVADTAATVTVPAAPVPTGATPPPGPPPAPGATPAAPAAPASSVSAEPSRSSGAAAASASASSGSADERPLAPGELRRFGPGVPPQAAAVWHGAAVPVTEPPRRRRVWRWLLPLVLLLAVPALLFWRFSTPALEVTGVGVSTDPAGPGCDSVAVVRAEVETNGGAGILRYRWLRSDGTTSGEIDQEIGSGAHRTELVLRWSFEGRGTLAATATLEILAPGSRTAAVSFPYHCA